MKDIVLPRHLICEYSIVLNAVDDTGAVARTFVNISTVMKVLRVGVFHTQSSMKTKMKLLKRWHERSD